jgi:ribonuclease BN (tRNA processing enzyme)
VCLVPGIADGRFLIDDAYIQPEHLTQASCLCGECVADERHAGGLPRRALFSGALTAAGGAMLLGALGAGTGVAKAATLAPQDGASPTGDAVVFLGLNGGPNITPVHKQPAIALVVNGVTYLVDMGADTIQQLSAAGLPLANLRHAFITHHHSDHIAGYPALAALGMVQQSSLVRLDVWGPPPLTQMQAALSTYWQADIASREATGVSVPFKQMLHGHEVVLPKTGVKRVFEDGNVVVSAARVQHGSDVPDAYAYRFDDKHAGRSVVFSGDTAPTDNLVALARDADLLVHEVIYLPGIDQLLQSIDPKVRPTLRQHLVESHTSTDQLPAVAKAANVKRLALCHLGPAFIPGPVFAGALAKASAAAGFAGEIIVPNELDVVRL